MEPHVEVSLVVPGLVLDTVGRQLRLIDLVLRKLSSDNFGLA